MILLEAVGIILLVDFITGLVHWLEDSYWSEQTPLLGKWLVIPNLAHHRNGQDFIKKSWIQSSWDLLIVATLIILTANYFNHLNWKIWEFAIIIANANQIHKWAHIIRKEDKPKLIWFLQKIYILQCTTHHGQHHRKPNNTHFCTVTNVLNPILDTMRFWRGLEYIVGKKTKLGYE
jgi:ubiquitin-conjugating enzyme E2 variant